MANLIVKAHKATQSWPATILLLRLAYWQPRTKIVKNGFKWIAMTREQWLTETDLTLNEYKNAVAVLKDKAIIEQRMYKFGGVLRSHMRLMEESHWLSKAPMGKGLSRLPTKPNHWLPTTPILYKDTTYLKEIKEKEFTSEKPTSRQNNNSETEKDMKIAKSVHDVQAMVKANKILHKPNTAKQLEFLWKSLMTEKHGHVVVLTQKDMGMLKMIVSKSEGQGTALILFVADNWLEFAKEVQSQLGLKSVPTHPRVDFLLKHIGIGLTVMALYQTPAKQEAQQVMPQNPFVKEPLQLIAKPSTEKPATIDEFLDILSEDED